MAAVGALVGLGAAVWAAGQLSARLFSGAWLPVEAVEMGAVLVRLLKNPAHPAAAWPSGSRQLVPGAIAFWTTFGTVTLLPLLGALWLRVRTGRQSEVHSAAWASRKQLSPLRVSAPTPGRITLGYADRDLLAVEPRQSVIVIGPSQSGKTTGLAIPALLEWDGPVIATSVKQDLLADSIVRRRQMGRVWVYDPTGTSGTGGPRATWSPVAASGTWQGAQRTAAWLVDAARDGGLQDADFWYATAAKLLAPLLLAAATSEHTMADVVRWVDTQEEREVRFELEAAGVIEALHAADASWRREERQKSSVYTTAETVLRAFADPAVASSAVTSEIQPELLLDGGAHTLYVCAPSHEQSRLRPLFSALLQQVITAAYERAASDEPLRRPLLIVLDEAANIAPLPELDTLASTAAGVGIQLVTVWQDLAQIHTRYGDRAATVVNNHRAKIALSGISDTRTLEYFSRLVGESETSRSSTTIDSNGQVSRTEAVQHRRLAPDEALRQMTPNHGLLLYGHIPPAQLQLRPWYRNRTLTNSARGTPARRMTSAMRLPGDSAAAGRREEHGNVADAGNFGNGGSASP
jgi:type IV secretion system protein VirD4